MLGKILEAREERWIHSNKLLEEFDENLIVISLNIPGSNKSDASYQYAHASISRDFLEKLDDQGYRVLYKESRLGYDGPESYIIVAGEARDLKLLAIDFEEDHILGRIADIDLREREKDWSRRDFGIDERRCIICDAPARSCIVARNHSLDDLLDRIDQYIESYRQQE